MKVERCGHTSHPLSERHLLLTCSVPNVQFCKSLQVMGKCWQSLALVPLQLTHDDEWIVPPASTCHQGVAVATFSDIINAGSQAKSLTGSFHKPYADTYRPIPSNSRILEKKTWHGQVWATLFWQDGHNFHDKKFHISGILVENTRLYIHAPKGK